MVVGKFNGFFFGFGFILNFGIIIEDNVISLEGKDSIIIFISIECVGLKDGDFNWIFIVIDLLEVIIYN